MVTAFTSWLLGHSVGWFFLDSVDEARLNRKSFESALRRFARKLERALERARVLISYRMSDWKGDEDRRAIAQWLPVWEAPEPLPADDEQSALLTPIFEPGQNRTHRPSQEPEHKLNELLIVQLAPLSDEQRSLLAAASSLQDVVRFMAAIDRHGLDVLAERPGDLLELTRYWKNYGCFDTLARMTDHGITVKLSECDKYRPDNDTLSLQKAREGAERLAAALTLAKSLTLRTPGDTPDPSLAAGALDPVMILDDWTDAERNALIRLGLFVPSTYGRVRFHHRSTQEYLTARWFERLLHAGCPKSEIWPLFFAARYGVETVVLSLRPAAAWLAMHYPEFRDEIIRREPLVLLRYGDPGSLPLETRKQLLCLYAEKHVHGEIADDHLDHRLLWMFADEGLTNAIHEAWHINERTDFRIDLLRLIGAGAITGCIDLARGVAHDENAEDYARIAALRALSQCRDQAGLDQAAKQLLAGPSQVSTRVAASFARLLYPCSLTTDALLTLMAEAPPAQQSTGEGFPYAIQELYAACPDAGARSQFLSGLAELCLMQPFAGDYQRVSLRYGQMTQSLIPIARQLLQELAAHDPPQYLVRLLMAVERAEARSMFDDGPELTDLVQADARLNRALFWADVEEVREHSKREGVPSRYGSIFFGGMPLWDLRRPDLPWLFEDLTTRELLADQQIALGAIASILRQSGQLDAQLDQLRNLIADRPVLQEELEAYLTSPRTTEAETRQLKRQKDKAEQQAKASWVRFKETLQNNPSKLYDSGYLATPAGINDLHNLTQWLVHRTQAHDHAKAALQWRLLEEGFGRAIAEAYKKGMQALWPITMPERPKSNSDGSVTVKWKTIFSCAGIAIEAAEAPNWTAHLSASEVELAAQHGCMTEQGYTEWIDALVTTHPQRVLPVLRQTLAKEWSSSGSSAFLYHYANLSQPIPCAVHSLLFEIILGAEPPDLGRLSRGLEILQRLDLNDKNRRRIATLARRRLRRHAEAGQNNHVLCYLAFLLLVAPERAIDDLTAWLEAPQGERDSTAALTFGMLFGQNDSVTTAFLNNVSVSGLEELLRGVYRYIRPADDVPHAGTYTPNARNHAQDARDIIFKALLDRPVEDAYCAMLRLSGNEHFSLRSIRLRELARGKAERDAEPPSWSVTEVLHLERRHIAAVKTGTDLLRVVMAILEDITHDFCNADASSRRVLEKAEDEDAVQNWLAEQLRLRALERFHVRREAEVAGSKEPDIIVSSISAPCQIAIEVKHANRSWSVRALDKALPDSPGFSGKISTY